MEKIEKNKAGLVVRQYHQISSRFFQMLNKVPTK